MKKSLILLAFLFPFSVLAKEVHVEIKGMHCGGCEGLVEEALEAVPGVTSVKADAKAGMATLQMKDDVKINESEIQKAVSTAGKRYSAGKVTTK